MSATAAVGWSDVESAIERLSTTGEQFATRLSSSNRISAYHPDWRLQLVTTSGPSWVEISDIKTCWETFERLGRIGRRDVLEPGRCSAFMIALFSLVPGVREEFGAETYLVLPTPSA